MSSPKTLTKTPKVLKALTKKTEHLGALSPIRALFSHSCPVFFPGTNEARMGTNEKSTLKTNDERSISSVASNRPRGYRSPVAANSAIELGRSRNVRRNSAPITIAGAFFVPAILCYGGLRGDTFGCAGFLTSRSANPAQPATQIRLAANGGSSSTLGATPMIHTLNPSRIPVELQKAYCTQLLKVLLRYSSQAELSRAIATIESEVTTTLSARFVPGLNDASYDVYRRFWLKGGDV
jgi:hypothetical protein